MGMIFCRVCRSPASISTLRDPFGKSDEMDHYCDIHTQSMIGYGRGAFIAAEPAFQFYWRCEHHRSAIENFFEGRRVCAAGCHATTLQWHDSGFHQQPRGSREWAELQRNGL